MSESAAVTDTCSNCGAAMPATARFCPECGTPTASGSTVRATVPVAETGPVPVSYGTAERRMFGVAPPLFLLAVGGAIVVLAIILFATGSWPFGLILLGLAALLVAGFLEAARRRPDSPGTRASGDARERASSVIETWRARAEATAEVRRIHSGLAMIESERQNALLRLGDAAHRGDALGEAGVRAELAELDVHEADLHRRLDERLAHAGERIRKARLAVQETMMVMPSEPYPPPGEATPPQPAIVPEPSPPPDEGTPPTPALVPEPGPDPTRDPSE